MKLLTGLMNLVVISCFLSFQVVFTFDVQQSIQQLNNMQQFDIVRVVKRFHEAWQLAQAQNPSGWARVGNVIGDTFSAAAQIANQAYADALTKGLPRADATRASVNSIIQSAQDAGTIAGSGIFALGQSSGLSTSRGAFILAALYGTKVGFDFAKEYYIMRFNRPQLLRSILAPPSDNQES